MDFDEQKPRVKGIRSMTSMLLIYKKRIIMVDNPENKLRQGLPPSLTRFRSSCEITVAQRWWSLLFRDWDIL